MSELVATLPSRAASASASARVDAGGLRYGHDVTSMCPRCLVTIPGRVSSTAAGVVMRKTCSEHGAFESVIATDIASYERMRRSPRLVKRPPRVRMPEAKGCPDDCGLCPAHDQHTCLAIVEITTRCNLPCPVCLADSTAKGTALSREQVLRALQTLIDTEGQPVPLQFAGGEPTLHPELADIVRGARALAEEHEFVRGRDLRSEKLQAITHCRNAGLQVVLAVTVVHGVNDKAVWPLILFAVEQRLTGINFQSVVLSGRYPSELAQSQRRFTATHFMHAVEAQSEGQLRAADFMPMSCPDPRCGLLAYVVVDKNGHLLPLNRLVGDDSLRQHVADFSDWETVLRQMGCDSAGCGCSDGGADARQRLANLLIDGAECFSIGFHGMMDAYCFDMERARRCCVHKLTADGKLMPFCLYNMKYRPRGD